MATPNIDAKDGHRAWTPFQVGDDSRQHTVPKVEKGCKIYFKKDKTDIIDGKSVHFHHFNVLTNKALFTDLNYKCGVIEIDSNVYFEHLIMGKHTFDTPFRDAAMILFKPHYQIVDHALKIINSMRKAENGKTAPWLSIHAREHFIQGGDLEK